MNTAGVVFYLPPAAARGVARGREPPVKPKNGWLAPRSGGYRPGTDFARGGVIPPAPEGPGAASGPYPIRPCESGGLRLEEPRYEYHYGYFSACNARLVEDLTIVDPTTGRGIIKIAHNWVCMRKPHRWGRHKATYLGEIVRRWRSG